MRFSARLAAKIAFTVCVTNLTVVASGVGSTSKLATWTIVPSPNLGAINMAITSTLELTKTDTWAAGNGVFDHWNGSIWNVVQGASLPAGHTFDVHALALIPGTSPARMWAVGVDSQTQTQLIERWDGHIWSVIPSPRKERLGNLAGATAISPTDAWAVGSDGNGTLIEHWNGAAWLTSTPAATTAITPLTGITAVAANNVWAVGYCTSTTSCTGQESSVQEPTTVTHDIPVTEQWDGTVWRIIAQPATYGQLNGVAARTASNVWAVGSVENSAATQNRTLSIHWNGQRWRVVPSPNPGQSSDNELEAVAFGAHRIWTAGLQTTQSGSTGILAWTKGERWHIVNEPHPANAEDGFMSVSGLPSGGPVWAGGGHIEEWNGTVWSYTPAFNVGVDNSLNGLAPVPGTSRLWSVGEYTDPTASSVLIMRWDGTAWDAFVAPPSVQATSLYAVAAPSANSVWAVGCCSAAGLAEHWNGSRWSIQTLPRVPGYSRVDLRGIAAVNRHSLWVVGHGFSPSGVGPIIEHWNGVKWHVSKVAVPGSESGITFSAVSTDASNDVWAVGSASTANAYSKTLVERWRGKSWFVTPSPNLGNDSTLESVVAVSPRNVWAVGRSATIQSDSPYHSQALVEHWDGTSWQIIPSPTLPSNSAVLTSVAAVSATDIWAAGTYRSGLVPQSLVEHWNGVSWSASATVSPQNGAGLNAIAAAKRSILSVGSYYNLSEVQRTLVETWATQ
jgi:hypothetical protein